jgi:hypothetical protein
VRGRGNYGKDLLLTSTERTKVMDRLIRVRVLDKKGRSIPNATVSVFANGVYVGEATSATSNSGTVYTFLIDDNAADIRLKATYEAETPQEITLAPEANEWDFTFNNVEVPVIRDKPFLEEHLPGLLGVVFLLISIVLAIVFSEPTIFQRRVFIGTLAVGLAGIGAEIPGFLNINMKLGTKLTITAAGAMALFVLVWFFEPG